MQIPLVSPDSYLESSESPFLRRIEGLRGANGELLVEHAQGVLSILLGLAADFETQVAGVLFLGDKKGLSVDEIALLAGDEVAQLVQALRKVLKLPDLALSGDGDAALQTERLRKLVLALAQDVRVVVIRLASRLQTLRYYARNKHLEPPKTMLAETGEVLAPLANRLGIWQLKWELEDLYFRFSEPIAYKQLAAKLEEKRAERELYIASTGKLLESLLEERGIVGKVYGRPKHLYSISQKIRSKGRPFDALRDLRAFRIIVTSVAQCYELLSLVQQRYKSIPGEFDDYIARPKANGYQSLHIVLEDDQARQFEVQIRTKEMHEFAEFGVAAHWRYKEASTTKRIAEQSTEHGTIAGSTNLAYVRQLLAWQQELGHKLSAQDFSLTDDRLYALTPQGRIVELPHGSTPIDFAYHVHTDLGHRCRGAKVNGSMVALNHVLANGQTVEILTARQNERAGPSRDWLNNELGFVQSQRGKAKVRQWFNALEQQRDLDAGRSLVEKAMQREGKTGMPFDELATRLKFQTSQELFLAVNRELIGPRALELALKGQALDGDSEDSAALLEEQALRELGHLEKPKAKATQSGTKASAANVLVVGADFLLTSLSRCCYPVPPDAIRGFVTRGRGVSIHRSQCKGLAALALKSPDRILDCTWDAGLDANGRFTVESVLLCDDRQGLLRDVSDVFARNKINVIAVRSQSSKDRANMRFTLEVPNLDVLKASFAQLLQVRGVLHAARKQLT